MSQGKNAMQQDQFNAVSRSWPRAPMFGIPLAIFLFFYGVNHAPHTSVASSGSDTLVRQAVVMRKLDLPVVTPYVEQIDERVAIHKSALIEQGIKAGKITVRDWSRKYGGVVIINNTRVELGKYRKSLDLPMGEVRLVAQADAGASGKVWLELVDGTDTHYRLRLTHGETLVVKVRS